MIPRIILYVTSSYRQAKNIMQQIQDMFENCIVDKKNLIVTIGNTKIILYPIMSVNSLLVDRHTQYIIDDGYNYRYHDEKMRVIRQRMMNEPKEIYESDMWELLKEIKDGKRKTNQSSTNRKH